ncbi:DsbA family protein [Chromobacterium vaccinii]|uniref:Protein-disulfide isomerase n=1 Tax=Chromobacterium vaccinii TaxID=1108595 RepID=A0A1D9LN74_9NEIS|nr:DsbA family protein [Chromobacterium vaccinii]AOZ52746.1 protein-disulfide isomerase [Chromobacterium vaccinii]QND84518.1 Thioredoxin-like protein [Chromobacterium vaccinii]QND89749.1 Thioredoxin-like protein [Chromobacterium vaccinii]
MKLHYFYDPLCGWCYGASPLLQAAAALPGVSVEMHAGGMIDEEEGRAITPDWRAYVMPHDKRIAQMSGQPFGDAYYDGLLNDIGAPLASNPPIAAVLAAPRLGIAPLAMLARIQRAHYLEGRRIAEFAVLSELAVELGTDAASFQAAWQSAREEAETHIDDTRRQMGRLGLRGFPSVVLEQDGKLERLELSGWLGKPAELAAALAEKLPKPAEAGDDALFCTPDSCR